MQINTSAAPKKIDSFQNRTIFLKQKCININMYANDTALKLNWTGNCLKLWQKAIFNIIQHIHVKLRQFCNSSCVQVISCFDFRLFILTLFVHFCLSRLVVNNVCVTFYLNSWFNIINFRIVYLIWNHQQSHLDGSVDETISFIIYRDRFMCFVFFWNIVLYCIRFRFVDLFSNYLYNLLISIV